MTRRSFECKTIVIMTLVIAGRIMAGAMREGGGDAPEIVMLRRDEETLWTVAGVVMKTGEMILEEAKKEVGRRDARRMHWKTIYTNRERWNTLASQLQEVVYTYTANKGRCRW